jgi:hypothetical protein
MTPRRKQAAWLAQFLPRDAKALDLVPRAYVVSRPAAAVVVVAYTALDLRDPKVEHALSTGRIIDDWDDSPPERVSQKLRVGDWVSLVYAHRPHLSALWYVMPCIPWELFK